MGFGLAQCAIGREAFVLRVAMKLKKDRFERLCQRQRREQVQGVSRPIVDIDVRHIAPEGRAFLERPEQRDRGIGEIH